MWFWGAGSTGIAALGPLAADCVLDPGATALSAWTWEGGGSFFHVPWRNFVGWWLVGLVVYATFFAITRTWNRQPLDATRAPDIVFISMILLFSLGIDIEVVRLLGSVLPVIAGMCVSLPLIWAWLHALHSSSVFPPSQGSTRGAVTTAPRENDHSQ